MNLLEQSAKQRLIFCPECGAVVERPEPKVSHRTASQRSAQITEFFFVPCGHSGRPLTLPPTEAALGDLRTAVEALRRPLLHGSSNSVLVGRESLEIVLQLAQAYIESQPADPRAAEALDKAKDANPDYAEPPLSGV